MRPIYLDHNATSPLDPEVLAAMQPHWLEGSNPESRHGAGRAARRTLDAARQTVADVLGAYPDEVVFTSGGTEANNLAILGLARAGSAGPGHLITSPIEHPAVSEPVARLAAEGWVVDHLPVDATGCARMDMASALLCPETRLASLMFANNEVGTLQPVAQLVRASAPHGVPVHTDAVQAVGRVPVDFHALGVTTLALSAHKFHGPSGIGALLARRGTAIEPLFHGGGQQNGRRPGTIPIALCVGLAKALEIWKHSQDERIVRWKALRERLVAGLVAGLGPEELIIHGPTRPDQHLPQTVDIAFPHRDGNALLMQLDLAGVFVSLGAACASGTTAPSRALIAMGVPEQVARSSLRISLGASTSQADIDEVLQRIVKIVKS